MRADVVDAGVNDDDDEDVTEKRGSESSEELFPEDRWSTNLPGVVAGTLLVGDSRVAPGVDGPDGRAIVRFGGIGWEVERPNQRTSGRQTRNREPRAGRRRTALCRRRCQGHTRGRQTLRTGPSRHSATSDKSSLLEFTDSTTLPGKNPPSLATLSESHTGPADAADRTSRYSGTPMGRCQNRTALSRQQSRIGGRQTPWRGRRAIRRYRMGRCRHRTALSRRRC
jgi:hypothetical protein